MAARLSLDTPAIRERFASGNAVMGTFRRGAGEIFTSGCTDWAYALTNEMVSRVTNNILTATGNEITGHLGSAVAEVFYIVTPAGVEMTGNVGTVGISADQTAPTTGIPINAPDPSVSIELVATPAGLPITGAIGEVGGAIAVLTTGLPMTAHTDPSFIFTWTDVDDTTTGGSTWTDVDDSNSSTWTPVTPSDSSTWTPVDSTTTGGNTWTPVDSSTN